ncbi:monovalent cation:proton antiporter-2 (CPA2) family protein [Cellvibrio sp. pealriver]|uniref:monovalent cation:proton antiporter-2 (CPA2) family protein n=1 Tax=Cellvibrio sp. pealriver TaxID=1622269 RepID=UPI00066FC6F3|nr:monovalent cation:proton antiporter-2 (CPA2) family protein [Cellvibrio sp. pealriver]
MEHHETLLHAIYYLLAATIAVPLFRRLGLGAILGYLVAGAIIGPYELGLIYSPEATFQFSELGVVLLLFVIGLELNPQQLWKMRFDVGLLGGSQMLVTAAIITGLFALFLDVGWQQGFMIGLALALSSTAFAVPLMEEHKIMGLPIGRKGFSILLMQDLAVIPILLLLASWSPAANADTHVPWWLGLCTVAFLLLAGARIFNPLLQVVAKYGSREILTAAGLLIVLSVAYLMQLVGFSMSMGAFLAGMLLAQSTFRHQLAADIEPFKGLLLGLFFIAVGMSLNLRLLFAEPVLILALALALMLIKIAVITVILRIRKYPFKEGILIGLMLAQGGEFAFVVMATAEQSTFIPKDIASYVVLVVGISMALTSPLVILHELITRKRTLQEKAREEAKQAEHSLQELDEPEAHKAEVIIAGFGRFGQIIGRILTASNIPFNALDKNPDHIEFLKNYGVKSYYGDATRIELLEAAGIREAKVLVIALVNVEASLAITRLVKTHFPHITLIVRARDRAHAYQLAELGVENPIREIYESSLSAAVRTLTEVGYTEGQSQRAIDIFREHDQGLLHAAIAISKDPKQLALLVKQSRKELQDLFSKDIQL